MDSCPTTKHSSRLDLAGRPGPFRSLDFVVRCSPVEPFMDPRAWCPKAMPSDFDILGRDQGEYFLVPGAIILWNQRKAGPLAATILRD